MLGHYSGKMVKEFNKPPLQENLVVTVLSKENLGDM